MFYRFRLRKWSFGLCSSFSAAATPFLTLIRVTVKQGVNLWRTSKAIHSPCPWASSRHIFQVPIIMTVDERSEASMQRRDKSVLSSPWRISFGMGFVREEKVTLRWGTWPASLSRVGSITLSFISGWKISLDFQTQFFPKTPYVSSARKACPAEHSVQLNSHIHAERIISPSFRTQSIINVISSHSQLPFSITLPC